VNLFILDEDPRKAAESHNDHDVPKAIGWAARLLSAAHVVLDDTLTATRRVPNLVYDHINPDGSLNNKCALWVRESSGNYDWTWKLLDALCVEHQQRFGRTHSYVENALVEQLRALPYNIRRYELTPFPIRVPGEFRTHDAVSSYRRFYKKRHNAERLSKWSPPRTTPIWWVHN
jgi:hypothetical protein